MKKWLKRIVILLVCFIFLCILIYFAYIIYQKNKPYYTSEYFGIKVILSKNDYNNNGIDDHTDIVLGARKDAENKPTYRSAYYSRRISTR